MKKNKIMRLAMVLLVAFLATTYGVSGTYAKYTTAAYAQDSARVAKWGIAIQAYGETFAQSYNGDTVKSSSTKIIAPGTSGEIAEITLEGSPEVAIRVSHNATLTLENWEVDGDYYCPVKITVNATTYYGMDYASAEAFEIAVEAAIRDVSKDYAPGDDISSAAGLSVDWGWDFLPGTTSQTNEKDGKLGIAAKKATINLNVTTTVTQID